MSHRPMRLTREQMVQAIRDEFSDTMAAADILDDDRSRLLVRMTVLMLWRAIDERVGL